VYAAEPDCLKLEYVPHKVYADIKGNVTHNYDYPEAVEWERLLRQDGVMAD
jgi:hypothetical protein